MSLTADLNINNIYIILILIILTYFADSLVLAIAAIIFCPSALSLCQACMWSSQSTQLSLIFRRTSVCLCGSGLHAAATVIKATHN